MASATLYALLLVLSCMVVLGSCQWDMMYFSPTSTRPIPDRSTLLSSDCPPYDPCQFYPTTTSPVIRSYTNQYVVLVFDNGTYSAQPMPGHSVGLTLSNTWMMQIYFQDSTFVSGYTVNFGSATQRPFQISVDSYHITIQNPVPAFAFHVEQNVTVSNLQVDLQTSTPSFATFTYYNDYGLLDVQRFKYSQVSTQSSNAIFDIDFPSNSQGHWLLISSASFSADATNFVSFRRRAKLGILSISDVNYQSYHDVRPMLIKQVTASSEGSMLVDSFTLKNAKMPLQINPFEVWMQSVTIDNCNMAASSLIFNPSEISESVLNVFRLTLDGGLLNSSLYANINLDSNYFHDCTVVCQGASNFTSHNDRVEYSVLNYEAPSKIWVDSAFVLDSHVSLGTNDNAFYTVMIVISYSIFENHVGVNETVVIGEVIILADSSWVGEGWKQAYLWIQKKSNLPSNRIYGRATVDSLSLRGPSGTTHNFAEIHIKGFLEEGTIVNRGILGFYSNPNPVGGSDYCDPTRIYSTNILAPPAPDVSIISANVWSAGDCPAAFFGIGSYINTSEHVLQITVFKTPGKPPVVRQDTLTVMVTDAYSGGPSWTGDWLAYYPNLNQPISDKYGINGVLTLTGRTNDVAYTYSVDDFTCPDMCTRNGTCVGAQTCQCNPAFSGYNCYCWGLPSNVTCDEYKRDQWITDFNLNVDDSSYFIFPTGAFINGSVDNQGTMSFQNAQYDISENLVNSGELVITSTISQIRNASTDNGESPGCIYVPTSRSYAGSITFNNGSVVTVELDLASANSSVCPPLGGSEIENVTLTARRDLGDAGIWEMLNARRDAFEVSDAMLTATLAELPSNSRASKSKSLLDTDFSDTSNGKMVVVIKTPPAGPIETTLFSTRNTTDDGVIRLLVQVDAPEGTCTQVNHKAGVVTLFASPCEPVAPVSQLEPASNHKGSGVKWYYYGAPLIAVGAIIALVIILVVTIPSIRTGVSPYVGSNT